MRPKNKTSYIIGMCIIVLLLTSCNGNVNSNIVNIDTTKTSNNVNIDTNKSSNDVNIDASENSSSVNIDTIENKEGEYSEDMQKVKNAVIAQYSGMLMLRALDDINLYNISFY